MWRAAGGLYPDSAYGPACQLGAGRTFGNGLLSRFPILEYQTITLPNPYQREQRALLAVLIDAPSGQLPVFVTHLDWQLDGSYARCQQVRFIADQIDLWVAAARRRAGADVLPAVLAGDFNAEPNSDEIRFLTGLHALGGAGEGLPRGVYFNDCYGRAAAEERPTPLAGSGADDGGATFARRNPFAARAREPDRRIDYIFAALPDAKGRGEPLRAWRCFREPYLGAGVLLRALPPAASSSALPPDAAAGVFCFRPLRRRRRAHRLKRRTIFKTGAPPDRGFRKRPRDLQADRGRLRCRQLHARIGSRLRCPDDIFCP